MRYKNLEKAIFDFTEINKIGQVRLWLNNPKTNIRDFYGFIFSWCYDEVWGVKTFKLIYLTIELKTINNLEEITRSLGLNQIFWFMTKINDKNYFSSKIR
jgi:hypothetical protein